MSEPLLTLAFPSDDVAKLKRIFPGVEEVPYLYFGADFFARRQLRRELGRNFKEIDLSRRLDVAANSLKADHVRWIDGLNEKYGEKLDWWFGSVSSRNVYTSRLFQYSCYLEVLRRLWQSAEGKPQLICLESPGLARAIRQWGVKHGIIVRQIPGYAAKLAPIRSYWFSLLKWGYFALTLVLRRIAAHRSKPRKVSGNPAAGPLTLIQTFVHDACLSGRGEFHDRYFPHLHEFLANQGVKVRVHPTLYGFGLKYYSIYARLRRSDTDFIIPEDYLTPGDYFYILTYPIRALRQKVEAPDFAGFNLNEIVKEERRRNAAENSSLLAGVIYRLFRRLGQAGEGRPQRLIMWYENQVTDKALIVGARRAFPEAEIIGVQLYHQVANDLNLFPCPSEVAAGLTPDLLLTMGEGQCRSVQAFTRDIPCQRAAALRYGHLFQEAEGQGEAAAPGKSILVLLPFELAESVEMLETLKAGLAQIGKEVPIAVKCHPNYQPDDLWTAFGKANWPERFRIFRGALSAGLQEAGVVISANSSAIADAVVSGKPVLFLCRQTVVNQRILADLDIDLITECYNTGELVDAIHKNLDLTAAEVEGNRRTGRELRDKLFQPINPETMRPFLGLGLNETVAGSQ